MWRIIAVLTRIWTRELPLSCSGTPEGRRCLFRCFSFFFSNFFLPLRFCLFLFFFLGVSSPDELLGSWTEAVVGHATLLCSEERLMQKYAKNINSRHAIKQVSVTSVNKYEVWNASNVVKVRSYLVKQLGEGTKERSKQDGLNSWESWVSPEESKVFMLNSVQVYLFEMLYEKKAKRHIYIQLEQWRLRSSMAFLPLALQFHVSRVYLLKEMWKGNAHSPFCCPSPPLPPPLSPGQGLSWMGMTPSAQLWVNQRMVLLSWKSFALPPFHLLDLERKDVTSYL